MSAARRLASEFVLEHVKLPAAILDFGSGDGHLAHLLGCPVTEHDRRTFDATRHGLPLPYKDETFDYTVCLWSIQHNMPIESQSNIVGELRRCSKKGGFLIVVASMGSHTFYQGERADPQIVLALADHLDRIAGVFGQPILFRPFYYEHGTDLGEWTCENPNAIAYVSRREQS